MRSGVRKMLKYLFQIFERENLQNQYLNYILMIINQNILAILNTYSICKKKVYERLYTKETTSKAATTNFFSKIPKRKKISNDRFNLYKAKISLNEIIKSIKSQTNSKSSGNDPLTT